MNLLAQVPIGPSFGSQFGQTKGVNDLVSLILKGAFVLAGIVIIFYFILGGYMIISGGASGDPKAAAQGKQAISSAFIGLVIVFVAYWIVRAIELITGGSSFITNPGL